MKALVFAVVGVCMAGVGSSEAPAASSELPSTLHPAQGPCLLLSSHCWRMNKIPVAACEVRHQNAKTREACAVDGMKLIDTFIIEPSVRE